MRYGKEAYVLPKISSSFQGLASKDQNTSITRTKSCNIDASTKFTWPSGAEYVGDVVDGRRTGKGKQTWPSGSSYEGDFYNDMRHGNGKSKWESGEQYEGEFFKDHRHGSGIYTWPDGSQFRGYFYLGRKEGYGKLFFSNGDIFEGLYKKDERCGPGIMTYKQPHKQDIGLWYKEKLIRLCTEIDDVFNIKDHPEYQYYPNEHFTHIIAKDDENKETAETLAAESIFRFGGKNLHSSLRTDENFLPEGIEHYCRDFEHLPVTSNFLEALDMAFFKDHYDLVKSDENAFLLVRNSSPIFIEMHRQIYRFRHSANACNNIAEMIEKAPRDEFHTVKGNLEISSENLIKAATVGDSETVYEVLRSGLVNPNVCDSRGNTALLGAAINCHAKIVNLLLDMGANIDQVNDDAVAALNACHVFYYPVDHFKPNIAETYITESMMEKQPKPVILRLQKSIKSGSAKRRNSSRSQSPTCRKDSYDSERITPSPTRSSTPTSPMIGFDKKAAMDCCRSDVRIKARYREISSGRNESRRKLKSDIEWSDKDEFESISSNVSFESASVDTSQASKKNLIDFYMDIPEDLIERTAVLLSRNQRAVSGMSTRDGQAISLGTAGALAVWKAEHEELRNMIHLLLQRGASPNKSGVPMYPLFFATKAGDTDAILQLLLRGASTEARISPLLGGFTPIHIASAIPGKQGVLAVQLLLQAGANPNATAQDEDISHSRTTGSESGDSSSFSSIKKISPSSQWVSEGLKDVEEGGRTPLHIACDRDDDYKLASEVVYELMDNGADPDVIWSGHSPLSLAVASGNDYAVDVLLRFGADVSLPLKRGVGNALCAASSTEYEHRRTPEGRIKLIDKLVKAGGSMLAPVVFGSKQVIGTVVDYAYWVFGKDTRIAHTPYHALTYQERDKYNARKSLLMHLGNLLREAAVKVEREKLKQENKIGIRTLSPSRNERFLYTGAGANSQGSQSVSPQIPPQSKTPTSTINFEERRKTEDQTDSKHSISLPLQAVIESKPSKVIKGRKGTGPIRKPLFRYCYECGRSVGVRLTPCSRCKEVYYCSRSCKLKAWDERHKNECLRVKVNQNHVSPSPEQVASYFTVHTLKEVLPQGDTQMDSVKILPKSVLQNNEFLPAPKNQKTKSQFSGKSRKTTASTSAKIAHIKQKRSQRKAHVSAEVTAKVGKEIFFGTTGMTLAELGITENYSFE